MDVPSALPSAFMIGWIVALSARTHRRQLLLPVRCFNPLGKHYRASFADLIAAGDTPVGSFRPVAGVLSSGGVGGPGARRWRRPPHGTGLWQR